MYITAAAEIKAPQPTLSLPPQTSRAAKTLPSNYKTQQYNTIMETFRQGQALMWVISRLKALTSSNAFLLLPQLGAGDSNSGAAAGPTEDVTSTSQTLACKISFLASGATAMMTI